MKLQNQNLAFQALDMPRTETKARTSTPASKAAAAVAVTDGVEPEAKGAARAQPSVLPDARAAEPAARADSGLFMKALLGPGAELAAADELHALGAGLGMETQQRGNFGAPGLGAGGPQNLGNLTDRQAQRSSGYEANVSVGFSFGSGGIRGPTVSVSGNVNGFGGSVGYDAGSGRVTGTVGAALDFLGRQSTGSGSNAQGSGGTSEAAPAENNGSADGAENEEKAEGEKADETKADESKADENKTDENKADAGGGNDGAAEPEGEGGAEPEEADSTPLPDGASGRTYNPAETRKKLGRSGQWTDADGSQRSGPTVRLTRRDDTDPVDDRRTAGVAGAVQHIVGKIGQNWRR